MPFFSIIIPCFNQAKWLEQSMQEIINQDFKDWEAIIINDGSTDDTAGIAETFALNDLRIKIIYQQNMGLSAARNTGIKAATGKWLNFHDADDYLLPGCLSNLFREIQHHPDFELFQTGYELVDEQNVIIHSGLQMQPAGLFLTDVFVGNPGPPLSFFISTMVAADVGEFDTSLKSAEDWDFWIRVAKMGVSRFTIRKPWVAYRYNSNSMSRKPWIMYENTLKAISRIPLFDNRIKRKSVWNKDQPCDEKKAIKIRLIQCLGLNIMQGNIEEALNKFKEESMKYNFHFHPIDFRQMNSFMTFKNWYRPEDVKKVLGNYPKLYVDFFSRTNFSSNFQKKACYFVFEFHLKNNNLFKYQIVGKIINRILDISVNRKKTRGESGVKSI